MPEEFRHLMQELLGEAESLLLLEALDKPPLTSIRLNPFKVQNAQQASTLFPNERLDKVVPWATNAFYLDSRPKFTLDPLFHAGMYYVQEASSMFVEQALQLCGKPQMVLDLCAAPGGKSTLLRSLIPDEALLVSNEFVRSRADILVENMMKWGHERIVVTNNAPKDFAKADHLFDVILADVPCSGEGMFRKDNPAQEMWSMENVKNCQTRQRNILCDVWQALQPNGFLIYSTCTFNTLEDEDNVKFIRDELGAEIIPIPINKEWGITGNLYGEDNLPVYHFFPHKTKGEGFFLALLKKNGTPSSNTKTDIKWQRLSAKLNCLLNGIPEYEEKGHKKIPTHNLAMARYNITNPNKYPVFELTYEQALDYLRHQALKIDAPRGYVLVTYHNIPLGFVNNIGSHANNLYPQHYRIRHL